MRQAVVAAALAAAGLVLVGLCVEAGGSFTYDGWSSGFTCDIPGEG